jgi:hypothetical protein
MLMKLGCAPAVAAQRKKRHERSERIRRIVADSPRHFSDGDFRP